MFAIRVERENCLKKKKNRWVYPSLLPFHHSLTDLPSGTALKAITAFPRAVTLVFPPPPSAVTVASSDFPATLAFCLKLSAFITLLCGLRVSGLSRLLELVSPLASPFRFSPVEFSPICGRPPAVGLIAALLNVFSCDERSEENLRA